MCGVCGVIGFEQAAVRRMNQAMVHRGPDDSGIYADGAVCLGHVRLSILDTSAAGHQPMCNEDDSLWTVFNGEIYNYRELRRQLRDKGHHFRSSTDTEVLVHLYEEYGEGCVDHLRGMFAFAIWDSREKRLFLARDRFGIKPLFYAVSEGALVFASELRALLHSGVVPRQLNDAAVYGYLQRGSVQAPETLIAGVKQLMPGHWGTFAQGSLRTRRYWGLHFADGEGQGTDERDHAEKVRSILQEAVSLHLASDVPLGVFLSGGVDSSAIVALMQQEAAGRTATLSVVFDEAAYDERQYSQQVAQLYGTDHEEIMVRPADIMAAFPSMFEAMDQPSIDGFNTFIISKMARQAGLTVALSGLGADEVFGGYPFFTALPKARHLSAALRWLPAQCDAFLWTVFARVARSRKALKAAYSLLQRGDLSRIHSVVRMIFLPQEVQELVPNVQPFEQSSPDAAAGLDPVNLLSQREIDGYLCNTLLHDADRMSMAHSLEVRVPFLDHVLVEAVAQMPGKVKTQGQRRKRLLINAMEDRLPQEIYRRPKRGFKLPFDQWLRHDLRDFCEAKLSERALREVPVLDSQAAHRLWREYREGSKRYAGACILTLLSLVNWHERHFRGGETTQDLAIASDTEASLLRSRSS